MSNRKRSWVRPHSLTLVAGSLLLLWLVGYVWLDPKSHLGSFCGNAIADWNGSVVLILGTRFSRQWGRPRADR